MPLNAPDGTTCFVDSNIFYYHFVNTPPFSDLSSDFLQRGLDGAIKLATSMHVIAEAVHKIMIAEAGQRFTLTRPSLVNWLQHNSQRIRELSKFRQASVELANIGLEILPIDLALIRNAADISARLGLLTNDAIIVALLERHALTDLATNDNDFAVVPGISIWQPR